MHHGDIAASAQQRIADLVVIGEGLLGEHSRGGHADDLGIFCLELSVIVVRTGREQLLGSGRIEVISVEVNQDILASQATQF